MIGYWYVLLRCLPFPLIKEDRESARNWLGKREAGPKRLVMEEIYAAELLYSASNCPIVSRVSLTICKCSSSGENWNSIAPDLSPSPKNFFCCGFFSVGLTFLENTLGRQYHPLMKTTRPSSCFKRSEEF
jgi:hypothetical protein